MKTLYFVFNFGVVAVVHQIFALTYLIVHSRSVQAFRLFCAVRGI